jgi:hypothetical protein
MKSPLSSHGMAYEILKPLAFGVAGYITAAVGLWFVLSHILFPFMPGAIWALPAVVTLAPLFLSGYVAARFTASSYRSRKVAFGVIAGLMGFGISLVITQSHGEVWFFAPLVLGAAIVAALGSFLGARRENVP